MRATTATARTGSASYARTLPCPKRRFWKHTCCAGNIETYFRLAKSYLKLRAECHSTSCLFYGVQREIVNELIDCAIVLMIDTLLDSVREYYHASDAQVAELVSFFVSKLPENWKNRFQIPKVA